MTESPKNVIIRDLQSFNDLEQAEALEREVWDSPTATSCPSP